MGSFLIYIRTSATITATLQRKHIIQGINGLWWQIICNGQWSSATPPWQMWQMVFSASTTGTHWFSCVWTSVADVYVILDDKTKTPYLHVLTNRMMRQGRLFNAPRRTHEFVKEFSSKHQGLFQKVLHLFEKVLSSVSCTIIIFLERTQKAQKEFSPRLYISMFILIFPYAG